MNIKAERIEQLIQLVNRNLQVILSGQEDGNYDFSKFMSSILGL